VNDAQKTNYPLEIDARNFCAGHSFGVDFVSLRFKTFDFKLGHYRASLLLASSPGFRLCYAFEKLNYAAHRH
jgi:hypothetical protein